MTIQIISGYRISNDTLTLQNVTCGLIRHKDTGKCVSKRDDSYLTLTDDCVGDRNIFCYDSVSRFIKLQDDENACVTIESNNLALRDCNGDDNKMKWFYTEGGLIKNKREPNSYLCWQYRNQQMSAFVSECDEEFYFQMTKSGGKEGQGKSNKAIIIWVRHLKLSLFY